MPAIFRCGFDGGFADVIESFRQQLTGHSRTLNILIGPDLLRQTVRLLWIDDPVRIIQRPKVSFQAEGHHRKIITGSEGRPELLDPQLLDVQEAGSIADIETNYDEVRF